MAEAEPRSNIGNVFATRLGELSAYANANIASALGVAQGAWYRPSELTGDLLNPLDLHEPFDRRQQEYEFESAVSGKSTFGTTTDLAMCQLQGDLMAAAERAFRARHSSAVRSRVHPAARLFGHSLSTGVLQNGMLGYIVGLDRINKSEKP